jgi:hypothetical protein
MARKTTAALTGLVAMTAAVVLATAGASQAAGTKSSAYGLALYAQGAEAIPPTPLVESTDGSEQTGGGSALPDNPLITGEIAVLRAGNDSASVNLLDLGIGGGIVDQLPPEVTQGLSQLQTLCANLPEETIPPGSIPPLPGVPLPPLEDLLDVRAACEDLAAGQLTELVAIDLLEISCDADTGGVAVEGVTALGVQLTIPEVEPNMALAPENPLLDITLNRQTLHEDGSFTVDGLVIDVAGQGELVLGSVTCGEPLPTEPAVEEDPDMPPLAPAPQPVRGNLPVTG